MNDIVYLLNRFKNLEIVDFHKFIYQGILGSNHFLDTSKPTKKNLINYIEKEMEVIGSNNEISEKLFVQIIPNSDFYHLNLRPFKKIKNKIIIEFLLERIWKTAFVKKNFSDFDKRWDKNLDIIKKMNLFPQIEIDVFQQIKSLHDYEVFNHSNEFKKSNHPHYRIIYCEFLEEFRSNFILDELEIEVI